MTDVQSVVKDPTGTIVSLVQLIYNVSGGHQATTTGMTSLFDPVPECVRTGCRDRDLLHRLVLRLQGRYAPPQLSHIFTRAGKYL